MSSPEQNQYQLHTLDSWLAKARRATLSTNPKAPEVIAGKVLKLNKTDIAVKAKNLSLSPKKLRKLDNLLGKLLAGRPLSSVIGTTEFHGIKLKINPRVLSPRAESEELVEYVINNVQKSATILDIGTGSGAIGLAIAKAKPDSRVVLTDISPVALNLAKRNAKLNKLNNTEFIISNLFKKVDQSILGESQSNTYFVANLPYVDKKWKDINTKKLCFEPNTALFSGNNGMQITYNFLSKLNSKKLLNKTNFALIEHDPKQYKEVQLFCKKIGFEPSKISNFVTLIKLKT